MRKKLAIKGHSTRGKEVIELLKMLGGCDSGYGGLGVHYYYYISQFGNIEGSSEPYEFNTYIVFTLEEFLEKYPFKVGDKVVYTKYGDNCDDYPVTIESMKWTGTTIEYTFDDCVTCLAKDLKMWNGEPDAVISGIYLNSCDYADEVELNLGDYEIEVRDGRTYAVKKKPKYPNNYQKCCDVLGLPMQNALEYINIDCNKHDYYNDLQSTLNCFVSLKMCRDAYWKIAGEEMGLDRPWEPDWKHLNRKSYCIYNSKNNIVKNVIYAENKILAFPTEEMRDAFYENFKDLIEQCKELL